MRYVFMKILTKSEIFTKDMPLFKVDHTKHEYAHFIAKERIGYVIKSNKKYPIYKANCKACNKEVAIPAPRLTSGEFKSCGCSRKLSEKDKNDQSINTPAFNRLFSKMKKGAKERGYLFEIEKELVYSLIKSKCYYCSSAPMTEYKSCKERGLLYNGIDRINNSLGYIESNIVPCCFFCNSMKSNKDLNLFLVKIEEIYNNLKLSKLGEF